MLLVILVKNKNEKYEISFASPSSVEYCREREIIEIDKAEFVLNRTGTQCVWSSLETVGRKLGIMNLTNPPITEDPRCQEGANYNQVHQILSERNVQHCQAFGRNMENLEVMQNYLAQGIPIIVGSTESSYSPVGHALVITSMSNRTVEIIDTSEYPNYNYSLSYDDFFRIWDGWALVITP